LKRTFAAAAIMLALVAACIGIWPNSAHAADDLIYWGEPQSAVYDSIHPHTLNWSGNVLDRGGLNLLDMEYTTDSSKADIVINQYGSIGALSIRKLSSSLELTDPTTRYTTGFTNSLTLEQGAVYLVVLHDGSHAKIRIDRILPDHGFSITQVRFSYVLEAEEPPVTPGAGSGETDWGEIDIGNPQEDMYNLAGEYVFEGEGAVTIPWEAAPGEVYFDLYRSDNGGPYVKMTDFLLEETEFTDNYVFAGHTYLYKLVSYDRYEEPIGISYAIKVVIVPESSNSSGGADSGSAPNAREMKIELQIGSKTAYVNGKKHTLEKAPITYNGRTMIPLRFVSEALGAKVAWDGKTQSITITLGSTKIVLVINKSEATVNGKKVMMDVPAMIQGNVTMVPIRFVSEQLKQKINFDNKTMKITITGTAPAGSAGSSSGGGSSSGNASSQSASSQEDLKYFIGSWKMWVPAGAYGADGGTLTIRADGTITFYWNGTQTSTWSYEDGVLILHDYKSGGDWRVTRTDTGIRVSSFGVYEVGTRVK
jgi:hypothetical protein